MFWRRKRYQRDALVLTTGMSEQEKIETRCMAVLTLSLQREPVHIMTTTRESATRHAMYVARVGEQLGVKVVQLPEAGADSAVMAAYRNDIVVGPIDAYVANFDRGLRVRGAIALVEGEPPVSAREMLSVYSSVRLT